MLIAHTLLNVQSSSIQITWITNDHILKLSTQALPNLSVQVWVSLVLLTLLMGTLRVMVDCSYQSVLRFFMHWFCQFSQLIQTFWWLYSPKRLHSLWELASTCIPDNHDSYSGLYKFHNRIMGDYYSLICPKKPKRYTSTFTLRPTPY